MHSEKYSHPNKFISLWQLYTNDANYIFPCNATASSDIIPINVSVSGWYIKMSQIIFSHAVQWYFLILS